MATTFRFEVPSVAKLTIRFSVNSPSISSVSALTKDKPVIRGALESITLKVTVNDSPRVPLPLNPV